MAGRATARPEATIAQRDTAVAATARNPTMAHPMARRPRRPIAAICGGATGTQSQRLYSLAAGKPAQTSKPGHGMPVHIQTTRRRIQGIYRRTLPGASDAGVVQT